MPYFYVYETVTFPIQLSDPDALQDSEKVVVTISQKSVKLDKENPSLDKETGRITLYLNQEETAMFKPKSTADIQVNIYYENGERDVTNTAKIRVLDNLYKKVMSND